MAIYVTSDAHGHVRALDEALSKISLTSDDTLYVLGRHDRSRARSGRRY